jgi:hypothetical protein
MRRRGLTLTRIISVLAEVAPVLAALPVGAAPATLVEHRVRPKRDRKCKNKARSGITTVLP